MATPTIREVVKNVTNASTSVTTGAATAVGDLLVAIHQTAFRATTDLVSPTGTAGTWSQIATADQATIKVRAWQRSVTAGGAQTVTVTPPGAANTNSLLVLVLSGADQSGPIDGTPATATGASGTAHAVGAVTTGSPDALLIGSWGVYGTNAGGYTAPASMVERAETNLSASNAQMVATQALVASGSTGSRTATSAAAASGWGGVLFAVKAARTGAALATVRLTASSTGGPSTRSGSPTATLKLAAGIGGLSTTRSGSSTATAVRLAAAADGSKAGAGSPSATVKLTASSTGNKVNIGLAVMVLSATVADVLHAGAGTPGTVPAAQSLSPSESLFPSPTLYPAGSPVTDPVRLSAGTAQNSRATSGISVAAVLLLGTSTAASSSRASDSLPAPLYLSAVANAERVVVEIRDELRDKLPSTVAYELVCVAVVPQAGGPPTFIEVDPIAWTGLSYTDQLSKAQTLSAGCQISNLTEAVLQRLRNPAELPSELWLYRAGRLVFAGPLLGGQVQGEALTLQAKGLLSYLDRMVVNADLVFSQTDQFDIAVALIDQWQNLEYGDYGIDTAGIGPCGVARDATYLAKEENYIGQRVAELGARENGFDVAVDPSSRKLRLSYPIQGVDRSSGEDAVVFDSRNVTSPNIVFAVGPGDVASEAYGTGTGTAGTVFSVRSNLELRAKYGRSAVTGTWNGVSEQTTLDAHVQGLLDARGTALLIPGPDVRVTPDADLSMWDVGDTVSYQLHSQLSIEGAYRLRERRVTVSKTGQESVSAAFV